MIRLQTGAALLGAFVLLGSSAQAQFVRNTASIPGGGTFNGSFSENVDFGDVDNDGDWDAIFADGGDCCDDQDRIWINQGGLQGGTVGVFTDETSTRFPAILQGGRDIEFVDLDLDGDLDIYTSNTSQNSNQSNRWWINQGGLQGGSLGFYQDDQTRWVGIASGGSSVANSLAIGSGGFVDWSCDCDFGDLDNDGDMDLVHSSYGGAFGGDAPTRIFLNTGGFFEEFNPSGFQLTGTNIGNGDPGIWSEGTQQANTTNSNGSNSDVASTALDIDLGDTDGDLDLDILHGAREESPRMFQNRLEENGGVLGFRDVTGAVFPAGYTSGSGHYEQEMGDLDNDDDLDIYGLNWRSVFSDITLENTGNGTFTNIVVLPGSQLDDNEGDFLDYDNDGDLDLIVANFSGQEKLYRNDLTGAGFSFALTNNLLPNDGTTSLDADACDVDFDGDYDIFVANDSGAANWYLQNTHKSSDTTAPRVAALEQAPDRAAGPAPTVVRVQVYDNAPYYITWYNSTVLKYQVDGGALVTIPMTSSGGQIFRAEIPGNLVGTICYSAESQDEYGNTGTSGSKCFDATGACSSNVSSFCTAKAGLTCGLPSISGSGQASATATSGFTVSVAPARGNKLGVLMYNTALAPAPLPFNGGLLCVRPQGLRRGGPTSSLGTNGACDGVFSIDMNSFAQGLWVVPPTGAIPSNNPAGFLQQSGTDVFCQFWGRDSVATGSFVSDGLKFTICP